MRKKIHQSSEPLSFNPFEIIFKFRDGSRFLNGSTHIIHSPDQIVARHRQLRNIFINIDSLNTN